jgi:hypothetical protein
MIKQKNHKYLCYTSLLLIISLFYFVFTRHTEGIYARAGSCQKSKLLQKTKTINFEYILALFLIPTIICSQLFWNNPIKKSKIHKIDAIVARISIFSFILYTILYKFKFHYLFVLTAAFMSFYFSNYYSNKEWCSNYHLFYHGLLHIFCFISTFYAFTPI